MKKLYFSFLIALPLTVGAIGVPTSGIDWDASTITVQNFAPSHASHADNFQCFGESFDNLPIITDLNQLNFSNELPGPASDAGEVLATSCFQQAGEYQLLITLADQAGNVGTAQAYALTVKPAEAGNLLTTLEPIAFLKETDNPSTGDIPGDTTDCTQERLLANAKDDCTLRLTLRDDFGNVIEVPTRANKTLDVDSESRDTGNASLNTFDDASGAFIDGLRLDNGLVAIPFGTDGNGAMDFDVSALAPSIEIVTAIQKPEFKLAKIIPRTTAFSFPVPTVDDDGTVDVNNTFTMNKSVNLQFEPWVKLFLSDRPSESGLPGTPSDPLYFSLSDSKNIHAFAGTTLDHFLPSSFNIFVKGFNRLVGLTFENEDLSEGALDIDGDGLRDGYGELLAGGDTSRETIFTTSLESEGGLNSDENVAMGSKVRHNYVESDGQKTVLYPGGNLGSYIGPDEAFPGLDLPSDQIPGGVPGRATGLFVGADIEGKVLAAVDVQTVSDAVEFVNIGGISAVDIREDVSRNAEALTRGVSPINGNREEYTFNINEDFSDDVAYFEGATVKLIGNSSPMTFNGGQKTIVIKDGNLFIPENMAYAPDFNDSLGIILINSSATDPAHGHVFVKNDVQRLVGTYFSDGSILSTTAVENPQYDETISNRSLTNMDDPNAPLALQLLLEGMILTKNTLGGALLEPPRTPFGPAVDQAAAIPYDLHFVRRYVPPIDPITFEPLNDNANNQCAKTGNTCDSNKHSFVIRTDGRVQNLTPPGFDQLSGFAAQ